MNSGYHIWALSKDFRIWRLMEFVGRVEPGDDLPLSSPGHWWAPPDAEKGNPRGAANQYALRHMKGRIFQVRRCTWPDCGGQHLEEFLRGQPAEVVDMVKKRKAAEGRRRRERRKERAQTIKGLRQENIELRKRIARLLDGDSYGR